MVVFRKYRLIYMDGSTEVLELPGGVWTAWFVGRVRARRKGTYLLNIEEIPKRRRSVSAQIHKVTPEYKLWLLSEIERNQPFLEHIYLDVPITHPIWTAILELKDLGYVERETKEVRLKSPWGPEYIKLVHVWKPTAKGKELLQASEEEAKVTLSREEAKG